MIKFFNKLTTFLFPTVYDSWSMYINSLCCENGCACFTLLANWNQPLGFKGLSYTFVKYALRMLEVKAESLHASFTAYRYCAGSEELEPGVNYVPLRCPAYITSTASEVGRAVYHALLSRAMRDVVSNWSHILFVGLTELYPDIVLWWDWCLVWTAHRSRSIGSGNGFPLG